MVTFIGKHGVSYARTARTAPAAPAHTPRYGGKREPWIVARALLKAGWAPRTRTA